MIPLFIITIIEGIVIYSLLLYRIMVDDSFVLNEPVIVYVLILYQYIFDLTQHNSTRFAILYILFGIICSPAIILQLLIGFIFTVFWALYKLLDCVSDKIELHTRFTWKF